MADATCSIEGCDRAVRTGGWCGRHYARWLRHGDPLGGGVPRTPIPPGATCTVGDCQKSQKARGLCSAHWWQWRNHGDPTHTREAAATCPVEGCGRNTRTHELCTYHRARLRKTGTVPKRRIWRRRIVNEYENLPGGVTQLTIRPPEGLAYTTVFDTADLALVRPHAWNVTHQGYVMAPGSVRMHRLILGLGRGDRRTGDHISGNRSDNRRANLRITTNQRNVAHQAIVNNRGRSRFRNVQFHHPSRRWCAVVMIDRKNHWLGSYATEEEAAQVAAEFRVKHGLPSGY